MKIDDNPVVISRTNCTLYSKHKHTSAQCPENVQKAMAVSRTSVLPHVHRYIVLQHLHYLARNIVGMAQHILLHPYSYGCNLYKYVSSKLSS
jgi:hypothetical protein